MNLLNNYITSDINKLNQIIFDLLSNGLKFAKELLIFTVKEIKKGVFNFKVKFLIQDIR